MQPCGQEAKIARIETTIDHVVALMDKHEEREARMVEAMEKVAGQAEILHAHAETLSRHEKAFDELFTTSRAKKTLAISIMESQYGIYLIMAVIMGTIVDVLVNSNILKKLGVM